MKVFSTILILGIILSSGCSEQPNEIGRGLLLPQDTLHIEKRVFTATSDTTVIIKGNDNLGRIFCGINNTIEAASIMEFSVAAFTSTQVIDSARIILTRNYSYLDSTGPFAITAYQVSHSWTTTTSTWDTLTAIISDTIAGSMYTPSVIGDSTLSIPMDTSIIRLWSKNGSGMVALKAPHNVLGMNIIEGFANYTDLTGDYRPELRISYHEAADTTIQINLRSTRAISVFSGSIPQQQGTMILQSSLVSRSILRFDTLSLPAHVSITEASVWIPVNPGLTALNNYSHDSIVIYMLRNFAYPFDSVAYSTVCSPVIDSSGQKYYSGDMKNIVQYWSTRGQNIGIILHPYGEYSTLDRFGLFGAASTGVRPKLKITFTALP
jgi:hypothetical protein